MFVSTLIHVYLRVVHEYVVRSAEQTGEGNHDIYCTEIIELYLRPEQRRKKPQQHRKENDGGHVSQMIPCDYHRDVMCAHRIREDGGIHRE